MAVTFQKFQKKKKKKKRQRKKSSWRLGKYSIKRLKGQQIEAHFSSLVVSIQSLRCRPITMPSRGAIGALIWDQ